MTTTTPEITLAMSRQDGSRAAVEMISEGTLREEMLDATDGIERADGPGCFDWNDPDVSIGDVSYAAFCGQCVSGSRHYDRIGELESENQEVIAQDPATGVITAWKDHGPDWEDEHWDAFLGGFTDVAELVFRGDRSGPQGLLLTDAQALQCRHLWEAAYEYTSHDLTAHPRAWYGAVQCLDTVLPHVEMVHR